MIIIDRHMTERRHVPQQTPTNQERYAAFRAAYPATPANNHPWKWSKPQ